MVIQLSKYLILIMVIIPYLGKSQNKKYAPNTIIDSLIKVRLLIKNRTISYDVVSAKDFNINGVKLFSNEEELLKKLGKGVPFKQKYLDNSMDVDNPIEYFKNYIKIKNSLFQLNDQKKFIGAEIKDSDFEISFNKISIGEDLKSILKKLPFSKREVIYTNGVYKIKLQVKGIIESCSKCSTYLVLDINSKTERLEKIFFEITDEVQY